jgi:hypothetical protein
MHPQLEEAFGFTQGQLVRMLVETTGADEHDEERTFPAGAIGIIDSIQDFGGEQGIAFTIGIEGQITNVFDQGDGMPETVFFEPLGLEAHKIFDVETYIEAAAQHGEDSDPDHEVGDLQNLLRAAFAKLSHEQVLELFFQEETQNVLISGNMIESFDPSRSRDDT